MHATAAKVGEAPPHQPHHLHQGIHSRSISSVVISSFNEPPPTITLPKRAIVESYSYRIPLNNTTMAAPEVHHLFHHPIADHSFSADRRTLAVARDTTVELYGRTGNAFKLKDELKGHDKTVTSVDIAPSSGRIVTCSQGKSQPPPSKPPTY